MLKETCERGSSTIVVEVHLNIVLASVIKYRYIAIAVATHIILNRA